MKFYLSKHCTTLRLILILATVFALAPLAQAAVPSYLPYPSEDSAILNPYGQNDEAAQLIHALQPFYRTVTGRSLKIEDLPGRGGATAWGALAEREGDGYTLAVSNLQSVILRSLAQSPSFRMSEIFNTNIVAEAPLVLWVPQNSPFPNLKELVRSAQTYPNQLIISGAGSSTQMHLTSMRLNFMAGIKTIYLPYVGNTTAMEASKMGQAHAAWGLPMLEYNKKLGMRPLAVAAKNRLASMPDLPTFEESSIGLFETAHLGLAIPGSATSGTRQAVAAYFYNIFANKDLQNNIVAMGFTPLNMSLDEIGQLVEKESARLKELLEQYNLD